MKPTIKPLNLL